METTDWQAVEELSEESSIEFRQRCYDILSVDSSRDIEPAIHGRARLAPPSFPLLAAAPSTDPVSISHRITYLLTTNGWTKAELASQLAERACDAVSPMQLHRWMLGDTKPPRRYLRRLEELSLQTALHLFGSPQGLRYMCNLSSHYGENPAVRTTEAAKRLNEVMIRECPHPPAGALNISIFKTQLPEGVRAQCFCSDQDPPRWFVILVRDAVDWLSDARDEIFAHVLPITNSPKLEIKRS
jgi:hypothetical protein